MFARLLNTIRRSLRRISPPPGRKWHRPRLEALDQRLLPAVYTFVGTPANGQWSVSSNWFNGQVPPPVGADVVLGAMAGAKASVADLPGLHLNSLTIQPGYTGTLTITTGLVVTNLTQASATVNVAAGHLNVHEWTMTAGTMGGAAPISIISNGPADSGSLAIEGAATINAQALTIDTNASLDIDAATAFGAGSHVTQQGETNWSAGDITFGLGATFNNAGLFTTTGGNSLTGIGPGASLLNSGTIVKDGGAKGTDFTDVEFINSGVVAAETGELTLNCQTFSTGEFQVAITGGLKVLGALTLTSSTATFSGAGMVWVGSTITVPQGVVFTTTAPVTLNGPDDIVLTGGGTFTSMTQFLWQAGEIKELAGVEIHGQARIETDAQKTLTSTLFSNNGTTTWAGAGGIVVDASIIDNYGTFDVQNDQEMEGSTARCSGTSRRPRRSAWWRRRRARARRSSISPSRTRLNCWPRATRWPFARVSPRPAHRA